MISVALVDFGDTLVDQTFMRKDSERFPTWTTDYVAVLSEMQEEWETGLVSSAQLAERFRRGDHVVGAGHCRQGRALPAALKQLGVASPAEAILIDNLEPNVAGWVEVGGHGYLFRDDELFVTDVRRDRVPGFVVDDVAAGNGR